MAPITLSALHGQTITFSLYKDGLLVQAGLAMTEIGSLGEFYADMPSGSADGKYLVCYFDGANKIASGEIYWANGVEVLPAPNGLLTLAEIAATTLNANIVQVNTVPVGGTGAEGDEWGPEGYAP
jgi:hypothetical protein